MIRRSLAGLVVVAIEDGAPEELQRWVRELPASSSHPEVDVVWRAEAAGSRGSRGPAVNRGTGGRWDCSGEGHHLLAILQDVLLQRSATVLHAAGLDFSGVGVVVVGRSGAGKSLVTLAALSDGRIRLLSDDLVIAAAGGRIYPFPTPIGVWSYHLPLLPTAIAAQYRRLARQSPLFAALLRLPGARPLLRAVRRGLARRDDRIGAWSRLVKSDFLFVPSYELVPVEQRVTEITPSLLIVLERDGPVGVTALDAPLAVEAVLRATYENEDMADAVEGYAKAGYLDRERHHASARALVKRTVRSATRVVRIRVPALAHIADAQRWLLDAIAQQLPAA